MAGVFDANAVLYDLVDNIRYRIQDNLEDIENAFENDGNKTASVVVEGVLNQYIATFISIGDNIIMCSIKHKDTGKTFKGVCSNTDTVTGSVVETAQHAFLIALGNTLLSD